MQLRALLFDLGNVLLRFSHPLMWAQMGEVTGLGSQGIERLLTTDRLGWRYEAGEISTAAFIEFFQAHASKAFAHDDFLTATSAIFAPMNEMLPVLVAAKKAGLRLVGVSNTNEAHMLYARPRFECFQYLDQLVLSYEVRSMKPDLGIYEAALRAAGCPAEACLFIDDLAVNVEGARQAGLPAVLFRNAEDLWPTLRSHGNFA